MKNYLMVVFFILINTIYAQSINLDTSFGISGYSEAISIPSADSATDTAILPNGQFITGHKSNSLIRLKKINQNGMIDTSFSTAFSLGPGSFVIFKKLVLYNDKIIVAGMGKTSLNSDYDLLIARFNLDGSLDSTFGTNGYTLISYGSSNDEPIDILNDDFGNSYIYAVHNSIKYFTKIDSNGLIDSNFGANGILLTDSSNKLINKVFLQNDGKLLLAGAKRNLSTNNYESYIERILQDGTYDSTFGNNGEVIIPNSEYCFIRNFEYNYSDNSILILHEFSSTNFTQDRVFLSKIYITDGNLISSFANNGVTAQYSFSNLPRFNPKHITTLSNSKILIAGSASNDVNISDKIFTMRFDADGNIDSSSGNDYFIFDTTPPDTSMRADYFPRLFNVDNDSFVLAYSGGSVTFGNRTYLAKFNGLTLGIDSILNEEKDNVLIIFPNPSKNHVTIQNKLNSSENFIYEIIDLIGRITKKGTSRFNEKINVEDLTNGTYIINVSTAIGNKFSEKIIIK
jgi:uncharacterized delta-60 repeat protein